MRFTPCVLVLLATAALLAAPSCGGSDGPPTLEIAQVKTADWRSRIGETVEVEGLLHLSGDGLGVLFEDLQDYEHNGVTPESRCLALIFDRARTLDRETYELAQVRVRGVVQTTTHPERTHLVDLFGDRALCEIGIVDVPVVIRPRWVPMPELVDPCVNIPGFCNQIVGNHPDKYAILFSGGIRPVKAHMRYWNDVALYYNMLIWMFAFDPANITVIYKDGAPENGYAPVHYAASTAGVNAAFAALAGKMDRNDLFFFFATNHGDEARDDISPIPDDELANADKIDECLFYYNCQDVLYDEALATLIDGLEFQRMCCVLGQCTSGGMVWDLRGPNRVICTACSEIENSNGSEPYDVFVGLFASALIGLNQYTGEPVDADEDGNGQVSIYEAFHWAVDHDWKPETPQYEDNGDGIPTAIPDAGVTLDGAYGSGFYL